MKSVVNIINRNTAALRRQYNAFQDFKDKEVGGISDSEGAEALFARIRDVSTQGERISFSAGELARSIGEVETAAQQIASGGKSASDVSQEFNEVINKLVELSEHNLNETRQFAVRAMEVGATANILERDLERVRDQLEQFAELAALGLAAEAVTHELSAIASHLLACDLTPARVAPCSANAASVVAFGQRVCLRRPFSVPGSGWHAPIGFPWGGLVSDRTVSVHWRVSRPLGAGRKGYDGREMVSVCLGRAAVPTAGGGQRSTAEPAATGYTQPRRARSSDRLAPDAAPAASSTPGSACKSAMCAPGRSVGHTRATARPSPALPVPPTTARASVAGRPGPASGSPRQARGCRARSVAAGGCHGLSDSVAWGAAQPRSRRGRRHTARPRRGARPLVQARSSGPCR